MIRTLLTTALIVSLAVSADAQTIRKSQRASVSQTVATTVISIAWIRPVARGRELFGALVPWGKVWTPGADSATTISITGDIRVNGATLSAGTYSIWAIPGAEKWTIIFSRAQPVFHIPYPAGQDVLRIEATPTTGPHMETLGFYFPVVDERHAELHLHWGTVIVPLSIDVPAPSS